MQEASIDFSNATRLKEITFHLEELEEVSITLALETLTSRHKDLRKITIDIPDYSSGQFVQISEETYSQWMVLDHILVQLRELNAVRIHVQCVSEDGGVCRYTKMLLPVLVGRYF